MERKKINDYLTDKLIATEKPIIKNDIKDKFETVLFLPKNQRRMGEGGLRVKGYFKHSYMLYEGNWFIVDLDEEPIKQVSTDLEKKINKYFLDLNLRYNERLNTNASSTLRQLPLISVVTVVYNREKTIEETIKSVVNQTYPNVEYIVIDGCSTDRTPSIIKAYDNYIDYWVSEPDEGIYDAMNKGIKLATGCLIGILNSDDWYEEDTLEKVCEHFNKFSDVDVYYGDEKVYSAEKKLLFYRKSGEDISKIKKDMIFSHSSIFVKNKVYKKIGFYDLRYEIAADYDLVFRLFKNDCKFHKICESLVNFRSGGLSSELVFKSWKERRNIKIVYGISPVRAYFCFIKDTIRTFIRKILRLKEDSIIIKIYLKLISSSYIPVKNDYEN